MYPQFLKFLLIFIIGGQEYRSNYFNKRELVMKNTGKIPEFRLKEDFRCILPEFRVLLRWFLHFEGGF